MMETQSVAGVACSDLHQAMARIDGAALARLEQAIAEANAIFVFGAGRSLLMLKAFAMRLMHIGLKVHVVGDVVTPALQKSDLLLLASASGETASLVNVAIKAKQLGGTVALADHFPRVHAGENGGCGGQDPGLYRQTAGWTGQRERAFCPAAACLKRRSWCWAMP